jgi:hypothetical protein
MVGKLEREAGMSLKTIDLYIKNGNLFENKRGYQVLANQQ